MYYVFAVVSTHKKNQTMQILLDLTASFSVMERRVSKKLISDNQDSLQYSLYCLQSRKSDKECWRGSLASPGRPVRQRQRKSTPLQLRLCGTKHSFTEQFSPQSSFQVGYPSHSLAQPSFELGNRSHSPAVPHLQQRQLVN